MKSFQALYFILTGILLISNPSSAVEVGINGRVRAADRMDEIGGEDLNRVRYLARVDGWMKINECLQVRGRLATGPTYNSEYNNTGLADGQAELDVNLRHLYVDIKCIRENVTLEMGAMPSAQTTAPLGLSSSGWVDGLRVKIVTNSDSKDYKREWFFTAGEIDELAQPNLFERRMDDFNYYKAEIAQSIKEGSVVVFSVADYDDSIYTRLSIKWALAKYVEWMESITAAAIQVDGKKLGDIIQLDLKKGRWRFSLYQTNLNPQPGEVVRQALLYKDFYGYGRNYYFEATKSFKNKWEFFMRFRDGDAGKVFETGVARPFNTNNPD